MLTIEQLSDPALHKAACRIANRLAFMIRPVFPGVERREFVSHAYALVREELEPFDKGQAHE